MKWKLLVLVIFFHPLCGAYEGKITLSLVSPREQKIVSGAIVTAVFRLENHEVSSKTFQTLLHIPEGWILVIPGDREVTLDPQSTSLQPIAFKVPPTALAKSYAISYEIIDPSEPDDQGHRKETCIVQVEPHEEVAMYIEQAPKYWKTGSPYPVTLQLVNQGNVQSHVVVDVHDSRGYRCSLSPNSELSLSPGACETVTIFIKTPSQLPCAVNDVLFIQAQVKDTDIPPLSQIVRVEIFPQSHPMIHKYQSLDMRTLFSYGLHNNAHQAFMDQYGRGHLDANQEKWIDLFFRVPFVQNWDVDRDLGGPQGRGYLFYSDPMMELFAGDGVYTLSPLLLLGRYGRGGSLTLTPGPLSLKGFYMQDTSSVPRHLAGGSLSYLPQESFALTASSMHTRLQQPSDSILVTSEKGSVLSSISARFHYKNIFNSEIEYGVTGSPEYNARNKSGCYLYTRGSPGPGIWYGLQMIYAAPQFVGYYQDTKQIYANTGFPIWNKLKGTLSYHTINNNLHRSSDKPSSGGTEVWYGGVSYSFLCGLYSSLYYNQTYFKDLLDDSRYQTQYVSVTAAQRWRTWTLQGIGNYGTRHSFNLVHNKSTYQNYQLDLYFQPNPRLQHGVYTRIGYDQISAAMVWSHVYGVSTQYNLSNALNLRLIYEYLHRDLYRNYVTGYLSYTLPNQHQFNIKGYWYKWQGSHPVVEALFSYVIPWKLPVRKNCEQGSIRGRAFYTSEDGEEQPCSNLIVSCQGQRFLTDPDGTFTIANMDPGSYTIDIANTSGGLVPLSEMPLSLSVAGGKISEARLQFEHPASVSGEVRLYHFSSGQEGLEDAGRWQDFFVHLYSSATKEKLVVKADHQGKFYIDKLAPGRWLLTFHLQGIPPHYQLDAKEVLLDLFPGDEKEIQAKLLPVKRQIRMLDQGTIPKSVESSEE